MILPPRCTAALDERFRLDLPLARTSASATIRGARPWQKCSSRFPRDSRLFGCDAEHDPDYEGGNAGARASFPRHAGRRASDDYENDELDQ